MLHAGSFGGPDQQRSTAGPGSLNRVCERVSQIRPAEWRPPPRIEDRRAAAAIELIRRVGSKQVERAEDAQEHYQDSRQMNEMLPVNHWSRGFDDQDGDACRGGAQARGADPGTQVPASSSVLRLAPLAAAW